MNDKDKLKSCVSQSGIMEVGVDRLLRITEVKNGRSSKSQTSRGNQFMSVSGGGQ